MDQKTTGNVFVVVRAYNEAEVIYAVVEHLCASFSRVIIVDDGSTDSTSVVLQDLPVTVVRHVVNLGPGAALQTGITYALSMGAEWIIFFDADGQHRVKDALRMLNVLQAGDCDVVLGSRFLGSTVNIPRTRKIMLKLARWFSNLTMKTSFTDVHNGLRVLNRKAAEVLDITQNGFAYASELIKQLLDNGMVIREVPVTIDYTKYSLHKGQSSLNSVNIIIDLIVKRFLK